MLKRRRQYRIHVIENLDNVEPGASWLFSYLYGRKKKQEALGSRLKFGVHLGRILSKGDLGNSKQKSRCKKDVFFFNMNKNYKIVMKRQRPVGIYKWITTKVTLRENIFVEVIFARRNFREFAPNLPRNTKLSCSCMIIFFQKSRNLSSIFAHGNKSGGLIIHILQNEINLFNKRKLDKF